MEEKSIARQLLNKNKHIPNMCPSVKPNGPKVLGTQKYFIQILPSLF